MSGQLVDLEIRQCLIDPCHSRLVEYGITGRAESDPSQSVEVMTCVD